MTLALVMIHFDWDHKALLYSAGQVHYSGNDVVNLPLGGAE